MSKETASIEENHPINKDGKKVVGDENDVKRFTLGDLIQVHLEMKNQVFPTYPHEEKGIVVSRNHEDDEYFYWMPVIQFQSEMRMFNPDHVIVVQRGDGSTGEVARLAAAKIATAKAKESKKEDENL